MQLVLLLFLFACVLQTGSAQASIQNATSNSTSAEDFSSSETPKSGELNSHRKLAYFQIGVVRTVRFSAGDLELEDFPLRLRRSPGGKGYQAPPSRPSSGGKKYATVSGGKGRY